MVVSGVMVGKLCLRMRVADGVSMINRAACMLGVSDAFESKPLHARHRVEASRVRESSLTMIFSENIGLYKVAFFVSDGFSILSGIASELKSYCARLSTQNDLTHLTEIVRLVMNGCVWSYD